MIGSDLGTCRVVRLLSLCPCIQEVGKAREFGTNLGMQATDAINRCSACGA